MFLTSKSAANGIKINCITGAANINRMMLGLRNIWLNSFFISARNMNFLLWGAPFCTPCFLPVSFHKIYGITIV